MDEYSKWKERQRMKLRTPLLLLFLLFLATPAMAQVGSQPVTTFTIAIMAVDGTTPNGRLVSEIDYDSSIVPCGLTNSVIVPPFVINATSLYFEDPLDPTRRCKIDSSQQFAALPDGSGYYSLVRANTASGPGAYSAPSNSAARVRAMSQPLPQIPKDLRLVKE